MTGSTKPTTNQITHHSEILETYLDNNIGNLNNLTKRVLNVSELRSLVPTAVGQVVYAISSYSTSHAQSHVGGGYFEAVDNTQAYPDDGGIVIKPTHPTLVWKRINFTNYDMQFWGVVADGATDNAAAITRAIQYAKDNRLILDAPAGIISTSEMVPLYNNMGIRGHGKAESTVFLKTTNNTFPLKKNGVTQISIDALVGFVPPVWDLTDLTMNSFAVHVTLIGCMFRRAGVTQANAATLSPQYGLFLGKAAAPVIRQVSVENGRTGIKAYCAFSGVIEMVSASQWNGFGFIGVDFSDYRNNTLYMSGTSMDMRIVQVRGYQFGFSIQRLQYSNLISCTAEEISPMAGETICYAFDFIDPYCISMINCATEYVYGGQIRVAPFANPSYVRTLTVENYLPIDQRNPVAATKMFSVDSGGFGSMKVTFIGGDLTRATSLANLTAPSVSGLNAKVAIINAGGEDWQAVGSGVFQRVA